MRIGRRSVVLSGPGSSAVLACVCVALVAAACDQTFEPLTSSTARWSVFGYLDASADTQWIRVMPIRPFQTTSPDSFGATVTLENLGTRHTVQLRDSVFTFTHYADSTVGSEGAYVHNFWTTEPIEPGARYRLSVTREGQDPAEAEVKIPLDYEVVVGLGQAPAHYHGGTISDYLRITGLKHLPFVAQAIHFKDGCGTGVDTVWYDGTPGADGAFDIQIGKVAVPPRGGGYCEQPIVLKRELWLVGSDSTWPSGGQYSTGGLGTAGLSSDITNAVGFVGGVLTKLLPYENCTFADTGTPSPGYCELLYDQASADLAGRVRETRCGDGPISDVTLQLTQLDQDPAEIRSYVTGSDGGFGFGALVPGNRYALKVRAKPLPVYGSGEIDIYTLLYDTLTFAPGEHRAYDVDLQRLTPCDQKP